DRAREVPRFDESAEAGGAGHVRSLADQNEAGVRPDLERLEPAPARSRLPLRDVSRGQSPGQVRNRLRVLGRRAAAAAGDVEEAGLPELPQERARHLRRLVVAAERIRQARVRVATDEAG